MIVLHNLSQLDSATVKAIEKSPALRVIDFGHYEVQGTKGNWYTVRCWRNEHGQKMVHCSCEETGRRRQKFTCYHLVPAVGAHILLAIAKKSLVTITYD